MSWTVMFGLRVCRVHETVPGRECATKANAISAKFDRSPEGVAKARLIAAAPGLLDEIKSLRAATREYRIATQERLNLSQLSGAAALSNGAAAIGEYRRRERHLLTAEDAARAAVARAEDTQ